MQPTGLTRAKLEELAKDERKTVLVPEYDNHEMWPICRLLKVVSQCVATSKRCASDDEARDELILDSEVNEFRKCHPILFKHATRREFTNNPKYVSCLFFMIQQRALADSGQFNEASQNVQTMTLQTCTPANTSNAS